VSGHRGFGVSHLSKWEHIARHQVGVRGAHFRQRQVAVGFSAAMAGHVLDAAGDAAFVQAFERGARERRDDLRIM
jgi:hypothetical protein